MTKQIGWPKGKKRGPMSAEQRAKLSAIHLARGTKPPVPPATLNPRKELVLAAKAAPCADCHGTFPAYAMDLDHVPERGPKLFELSRLAGWTLEQVQAELAKCDAVCAVCHRIRTHKRRRKS